MESKKTSGGSALPTDFLELENDMEVINQIDEDGKYSYNKHYRVNNIFG